MMRISESRLTKGLLGISVATTFLILGEVAVRSLTPMDLGAANRQDLMANSMFAGSPELGWIRRPGFRGVFEDSYVREFDNQGFYTFDSDQARDQHTPKILFIGDSNTFGYDVPAEDSFVEVADRLLPNASAINLGVPGYSSAQGLVVARSYLPELKPRIAVISFNFNDRRDAQTSPDSAHRFREIYETSAEYWPNRLSAIAERLHAYRAARTAASRAGILRAEQFQRAVVNLADARPRVGERDYERHLSEIVQLCVRNGVLPVFLLLRDAPQYADPLRKVAENLEFGDTGDSIDALETIIAADRTRSDARLMLAPLYRRLARTKDADDVLQVESLRRADGMELVRPDTTYNELMRRVAATTGATLIEGAAVLEADPDVFTDECHFDREGHRRVGELLAARLAPMLHPASR